MARDRRRIIYENDGTKIEEIPSSQEVRTETVAPISVSERIVDVDASKVFEAFASYTPFNIGKDELNGECCICGTETQFISRKICVNCMKKYGEQIYDKAIVASDRGERSILLNVFD